MAVQFYLLFYISLFVSGTVIGQKDETLNILIITGGHDFDRKPFFSMFDNFYKIKYQEVKHPGALDFLYSKDSQSFDVLVFYDMQPEISDEHKKMFMEMARTGKNMLFLHHAIVSYDGWEDYEELIGGHYYNTPYQKENEDFPSSEYSHDENITVYIENKDHPITQGLSDFEIFDETYNNVYINQKVIPLIVTDHPQSNKILGWINYFENSEIVYLQPGHGPQIFSNKNYQTLVERSIRWLAE